MKKIENVNEVKKGDIVLVKESSPQWDEEQEIFYDCCFEYCFEVVKNNSKTFGCTHINGPYKGSGFKWQKGFDLTQIMNRKYFLLEPEDEVTENHYRVK